MTLPLTQDAPPPGTVAGTDSLATRIGQVAMAIVPALLLVALMTAVHRLRVELGGFELPAGLLFGAAYQVVTCVFLYAVTGSRLPLVALGALWGMLVMPLAGRGAGGGVLMPAVIGEQAQYSGWILQGIGVFVPFLVAAAITLLRRRRSHSQRA